MTLTSEDLKHLGSYIITTLEKLTIHKLYILRKAPKPTPSISLRIDLP